MRSTKSKGSWEMLNKEQPKQGWQISHQEQVKEEESGQWLSENERKINLTSQSYVWQKYYSQLNIKQRCFQTWKHLWPICPNTRTVKECPEAKKKKKKSEARWKANPRKETKNNRMAITGIHACFTTHYLIIFKRRNFTK